MDQAQTPPRPMVTALLAALLLALLTLAIAMGLPGLASDTAGNGWHKNGNSIVAGNGWHSPTQFGNGWH
jgi:opacity protein-like surface antigen